MYFCVTVPGHGTTPDGTECLEKRHPPKAEAPQRLEQHGHLTG